MAGPMVTGGFAHLLTPIYSKVFFDEYNRQPEEYRSVAKISSETKHFVAESDMYGIGAFQEMAEADPVPYDAFTDGNDKTVYFTDFGLGIQVSRNMYEDDLTGHMKRPMAELGKAAAYTRELKFWDVPNSGESSDRVGLDGQPLFSESHPVQGVPGMTLSNIISSSLSPTSIEAACDLFEGLVNEKGIPIVMRPTKLIIPYQQRWKAKEIFGSELLPYEASNTKNPVADAGLSWQISHYLTDPNACYLIADGHDMRFMGRRPVDFEGTDDFNTSSALFKSTMRFQTTFFHWRGVVKITGA